MKTETLELTKTEFDYVLTLVYENIRDGWYYGNKQQFEKMQSKFLDKLLEVNDNAILRKVQSTNGMD
jgi:hypothetical protein